MEKLKLETKNLAKEKYDKLLELFPNAITETIVGQDENGNDIIERAIDADILRQEISENVVEGREERYEFTWPDKKKFSLLANAPINKTLRPIEEDSLNFNVTKNLYIEGDNLDVLKLLRETYLGKVKIIYIDPPYNTGNDFVYEDDFTQYTNEYKEISSDYDEDGNRLVKNSLDSGRYHSNWLNMMYPRLQVAKDLLTDDGVIFISIGQAESYNLMKCCDEIYGEQNRVGIITRVMKSGSAQGQYFSPNTEYILSYAKNKSELKEFRQPISDEIINKLYTSVETEGDRKGQKYRPFGLYQSSLDPLRGCSNQRYYIEAPDGILLLPPGNSMPEKDCDGAIISPKSSDDKVWRWSRDRYIEEKKKGNIVFKKSKGVLIDSQGNPANWNVYTKIWLNDRQEQGMTPVDLIVKWENRLSKKELQALNIPFDFAKPSELIKFLISIVNNTNESIILDFFSGSATTAHAVMDLNAEDGGNRKFIMVQIPEETDKKSEAYKAGYKNICEIGKERIRRAGKKIKDENPDKEFDYGFRVLKLDSSNMKDIYYTPDKYSQDFLNRLESNIKEDRNPEDLLFQVMLELGVLLSSDIVEEEINGNKVFNVADGFLVTCFDENISEETVEIIAKEKPYYAVFREGNISDSTLANFEQIFETYSPIII